MSVKKKKKSKSGAKAFVAVLLILVFIAASCFVVNYYKPDFFSSVKNKIGLGSSAPLTADDGTKLKGKITESVIWPEGLRFAVEPGDSFTFDIKICYTDEKGQSVYKTIEEPLDLEMIFSDSSYCDKSSFDTIVIKQDAPDNAEFMVTLSYKKGEKVSYGFVVYRPDDDSAAPNDDSDSGD